MLMLVNIRRLRSEEQPVTETFNHPTDDKHGEARSTGLQRSAHPQNCSAERERAWAAQSIGWPASEEGRDGSREQDARDDDAVYCRGLLTNLGSKRAHDRHWSDNASVDAEEVS